ncbi:hypothetical protein ACVIJ6_005978 [Bradyrhizobium sp. USDA 4369]
MSDRDCASTALGTLAFLFLRTTADTEHKLSGDIEKQYALHDEGLSRSDMLVAIRGLLDRRFGISLSNATACDLREVPRAKRLMAQTLIYLACAILEEQRRDSRATACSSYSRGAFPALLWSGVVKIDEFAQWGEEYMHLQRLQIEKATAGRDLGHCEVLLSRPYSVEDDIEAALASIDVWVKDYRSPRVLLLAGHRRSLDALIQQEVLARGIGVSARTPVTPCNAAHLPLVDPAPQQAYLSSVPVHSPERTYVAQASGSIAVDGSQCADDIRDFILHTGIGPMRTYAALRTLSSLSRTILAVGTAKSFLAICVAPNLQPHPVSHLPVGFEDCESKHPEE